MNKRMGANKRKQVTVSRGERAKTAKVVARKGSRVLGVLVISAVVGILAIVCIKTGIHLIVNSDLLSIKSIQVTGAKHVSADTVIKKAQKHISKKLSKVNKNAALSSIGAEPWVEQVKIIRTMSGIVKIKITERKPIALVNSGKIQLVDRKGVLFPMTRGELSNFPLISGLKDTVGKEGMRVLTVNSCERLNAVLSQLNKSRISGEMPVSQINFINSITVRMAFQGTPMVVDMDEANVADRLKKLEQLGEVIGHDDSAPTRVDLRYQNLAFIAEAVQVKTEPVLTVAD